MEVDGMGNTFNWILYYIYIYIYIYYAYSSSYYA